MYFSIIVPILSIFCNIFSQILLGRILLRFSLLKSVYFGFICGFVVFVLAEFIVSRGLSFEWLPLFFVNLIIYGCLSFNYFTFINMGETARRIRLLRELYDAPQGLTKDEILLKYNGNEIIKIRINRLLNNGQVFQRNNSYFIGKPIMLLFSQLILFMKLLICGQVSEFDR